MTHQRKEPNKREKKIYKQNGRREDEKVNGNTETIIAISLFRPLFSRMTFLTIRLSAVVLRAVVLILYKE